MKHWLLVMGWILAANAGQVVAGELIVQVVDAQARPVGDAVVTVIAQTPAAVAAHTPALRYVDQKDETFVPYVQVLQPGDRVVFRNSDRTRHHVYSFSPTKTFEFMLRPGVSSPALALGQSGIVAIGCNIHDHMIAYLVVSAAPARVTGAQGRAVFDALPPGGYTIQVWHPQLRPGSAPASAAAMLTGADTRTLNFSLSLLPDPRELGNREHVDY
jgi:plastocyanin